MKKYILINGIINSGKDEVGLMLAKQLKKEFTVEKIGFALSLKKVISSLTGEPLCLVDEHSYSKPVFD